MSTTAFVALCLLQLTTGFYLPGVAPIDYADGARVDLKVSPPLHGAHARPAAQLRLRRRAPCR